MKFVDDCQKNGFVVIFPFDLEKKVNRREILLEFSKKGFGMYLTFGFWDDYKVRQQNERIVEIDAIIPNIKAVDLAKNISRENNFPLIIGHNNSIFVYDKKMNLFDKLDYGEILYFSFDKAFWQVKRLQAINGYWYQHITYSRRPEGFFSKLSFDGIKVLN